MVVPPARASLRNPLRRCVTGDAAHYDAAMLSVRRACVVTIMVALAVPASASAADFRTPGKAAYCDYAPKGEIIEGGVPNPRSTLQCWTPNDGFWVVTSRRGTVRKGYADQLHAAFAPVDRVLRFGRTWRLGGFVCKSRKTGLTCRNRAGHGWRLGRFVGYRIF